MSKEESKQPELTRERAFLATRLFPEASQAFSFERQDVADCIDECDVVLDTNVLLLPYRAGPNSLAEIAKVLAPLRDGGRLFVPGQVAREFARNQPQKLAELYHALQQQSSDARAPDLKSYPLLETIPEYDELLRAAKELREAKTKYTDATRALTERIRAWGGNDPVVGVFRTLLTPQTVSDPILDDEQTLKEMNERYSLGIPPGYKDSAKPDGGVGDYVIWLTIKEIGKDRRRSIVFVTGEEKADWYHRASNTAFLPRYELVDEFRRVSGGATFYIMQLSELLTLLQAEGGAVQEVRGEEERDREQLEEQFACLVCGAEVTWRIGRAAGASAIPRCDVCGARFHAHRTSQGLITRPMVTPARQVGYEEVLVRCASPECGAEVPCRIGLNHMDSARPVCRSCGLRFHAHRRRDGSVFSRMPGSRERVEGPRPGSAPGPGLDSDDGAAM